MATTTASRWISPTQMAKLMNVQSAPTQITWSDWPQGLAAQQFDVFMNGLEMTDENAQSAKFTIPYYRLHAVHRRAQR